MRDIILPSAARASTGNGEFQVPRDSALRFELDVTASSSPTTLDVVIEHTYDGVKWFALAAFTQVGAAATAKQTLSVAAPTSGRLRAAWTAVGTSYTFSVQVSRT